MKQPNFLLVLTSSQISLDSLDSHWFGAREECPYKQPRGFSRLLATLYEALNEFLVPAICSLRDASIPFFVDRVGGVSPSSAAAAASDGSKLALRPGCCRLNWNSKTIFAKGYPSCELARTGHAPFTGTSTLGRLSCCAVCGLRSAVWSAIRRVGAVAPPYLVAVTPQDVQPSLLPIRRDTGTKAQAVCATLPHVEDDLTPTGICKSTPIRR